MKVKIATLPPKKTTPSKIRTLQKIAVWHAGKQPEIFDGYSVVVTQDGATIDQGETKRVIKGTVIVQIQKPKKTA
jgi:hypothetical protein